MNKPKPVLDLSKSFGCYEYIVGIPHKLLPKQKMLLRIGWWKGSMEYTEDRLEFEQASPPQLDSTFLFLDKKDMEDLAAFLEKVSAKLP